MTNYQATYQYGTPQRSTGRVVGMSGMYYPDPEVGNEALLFVTAFDLLPSTGLLMMSASDDPDAPDSWASPVSLGIGNLAGAASCIDFNDSCYVFYKNADTNALCYIFNDDPNSTDGGWSDPFTIPGNPASALQTGPALAVDGAGRLHLAFITEDNGVQWMYTNPPVGHSTFQLSWASDQATTLVQNGVTVMAPALAYSNGVMVLAYITQPATSATLQTVLNPSVDSNPTGWQSSANTIAHFQSTASPAMAVINAPTNGIALVYLDIFGISHLLFSTDAQTWNPVYPSPPWISLGNLSPTLFPYNPPESPDTRTTPYLVTQTPSDHIPAQYFVTAEIDLTSM